MTVHRPYQDNVLSNIHKETKKMTFYKSHERRMPLEKLDFYWVLAEQGIIYQLIRFWKLNKFLFVYVRLFIYLYIYPSFKIIWFSFLATIEFINRLFK